MFKIKYYKKMLALLKQMSYNEIQFKSTER